MSSKNETVQLDDYVKETFISSIDSNGIILYEQDLNYAKKDIDIKTRPIMDNSASTIEGHPMEVIEDINIVSLDEPYYPFKDNTTEDPCRLSKDCANSQIGPFSDNRPICECDTIKQLFNSTDARYLLSLLPDMAEMNPKQKTAFKNRIIQLINRILNGDSIDLDI